MDHLYKLYHFINMCKDMKRKYFLWVVMFALMLFLVPHENVMAENTEEAALALECRIS